MLIGQLYIFVQLIRISNKVLIKSLTHFELSFVVVFRSFFYSQDINPLLDILFPTE